MMFYSFRVFSFVTFGMEFLKVAELLWDCSCLICSLLYCIYCRPNRIGSSLSGAQNFFDLFDRTPSIDNASTDGEKLVSKRMMRSNAFVESYTISSRVNYVSYRLIFVVKSNLIKSNLFIQLDVIGLFLRGYSSRSNRVRKRILRPLWLSIAFIFFEGQRVALVGMF
jgi:hypothetical protein